MVQLSSPWPHEGQQQQQQQQIESAIRHKLESSGEIDRIHHSLHANLTECGWRNVIQDAAKEAIRRKGLQPITLDQLVAELTPVARATVPAEVKGVEGQRRLFDGIMRIVYCNGREFTLLRAVEWCITESNGNEMIAQKWKART
eukprot:scaffold1896_cov86-Skeletonema_dohrnii-CCMP3373.AAC.4